MEIAMKTVNNLTLEQWIDKVDQILLCKIGLTSGDLADFPIYDCWECGMSPEDGAYECIDSDDLPWRDILDD